MTTQAKGALKNFVPNKDFVLGTFSITGQIAYLLKFVNQVGSCPTPNIKIIDGISQSAKTTLTNLNTSMATTFTTIRSDANSDQTLYEQLWQILGQLYNCVHHAELGIKFIYKEAESGVNVDNSKVKLYLQFIQKNFKELDAQLGSSATGTATGFLKQVNDMHTKFASDIASLNTEMTTMQTSLSTSDKTKINLNNLTEAQAKAQLDGKIASLQSDADSLQTEITWETVGQVGIGIVGGLVAISNFWNPIGWAAAAGTAVGEVELAKSKASKQVQLAQDQQDISIEQEEEEFLGPFYQLKSYKGKIQNLQSALEQTQKGLVNINTFIESALSDIPGFVSDLGDPASLQLDYAAVVGTTEDPGDLISLANAIQKMQQFPAASNTTDTVIKAVPMANQAAWDKALNDPNSPYYIPIIKAATSS